MKKLIRKKMNVLGSVIENVFSKNKRMKDLARKKKMKNLKKINNFVKNHARMNVV